MNRNVNNIFIILYMQHVLFFDQFPYNGLHILKLLSIIHTLSKYILLFIQFVSSNIIILFRNFHKKKMKINSQQPTDKKKQRNIPTFLKKTCEILEDDKFSHIVRWAHNGIGFIIFNEDKFARQVLPSYFKHSNYSSFVRQLNMYNFHKIREGSVDSFFFHEFFDKYDKAKIAEIKRKPQKKKRKIEQSQDDIDDDVSICYHRKQIKQQKQTHSERRKKCKRQFPSQKKTQPVECTLQNMGYPVEQQKQNIQHKMSQKNILSVQIQDDKLSINEDMIQRCPRFQTRDLICASNNMLPFSYPGQISNFSLLL